MSKSGGSESKNTLYCSFCGKSQHEVRKLIAGPTVFICDECVELCMEIIREENKTSLRLQARRAVFRDRSMTEREFALDVVKRLRAAGHTALWAGGFDGFVVSDFNSCHSTVNCANSGMECELPSAKFFGPALKKPGESASHKGAAWKGLALEKAPFLLLAAISCGVTLWAQNKGGAVPPGRPRPAPTRAGELWAKCPECRMPVKDAELFKHLLNCPGADARQAEWKAQQAAPKPEAEPRPEGAPLISSCGSPSFARANCP